MKKVALLLCVIISLNAFGQNLVLNPSFEDTISCSAYQGPPQLPCSSWYWATGGSVDYFNNYCGNLFFYSVPANAFGFQYARTGSAYCGFGLYLAPIFQPNGYREYLGGQLLDTLKQGHTYCISFYVVKADSGKYYTSDIGMYLSPDSSVDYSTALNLPYAPQIINTNGIIYDTLNWTQISGTYVAGGGEKYFIIGNFNNDANTTLDSNNQSNLFYAHSYYYIDDVSVIDCTVGINEIENLKDKIKLMSNPAKDVITISFPLPMFTACHIRIYDIMGKVVYNQDAFIQNQISIPVFNLTNGIYAVELNYEGIKEFKKFVKE